MNTASWLPLVSYSMPVSRNFVSIHSCIDVSRLSYRPLHCILLTFGACWSAVAGLALADVGLDALAAVAALRALGLAQRPVGAPRVSLAAHVNWTPLVDQLKKKRGDKFIGIIFRTERCLKLSKSFPFQILIGASKNLDIASLNLHFHGSPRTV